MSFSKLVQLLQAKSVWFARVDELTKVDPFEGSLPFDVPRGELTPAREAEIERKNRMSAGSLLKSRELFLKNFREQRQKTYVSCWHAGATDNDAMWRLYGAEKDGSICIRSTVGKMSKQLPDFVNVGRVDYVSYDENWLENPNVYIPFFRKRTCFQHENEIRFLFNKDLDWPSRLGQPPSGVGYPLKINPQEAFDDILVAPTAPDWFLPVVEDAVRDLGFDIKVSDAPMSRRPSF